MGDGDSDRNGGVDVVNEKPTPLQQHKPRQRPLRSRSPDGRSTRPKFYLPSRSPVLEVDSTLTFGPRPCLPTHPQELARSVSHPSKDAAAAPPEAPKTVPFGRSRRMSRSLPELRDFQFVSVLPDVDEEETDVSEIEGEEVVYEKPTRIPWHRKLDFLWCSVCQALGLANFWRFPYYTYSNGGGSFVYPYLCFVVVCGVPFLCMELAMGQLTQSGPISAFGQLCPLMKGIGVASMMLSFWLTAYYSVLASWTLYYMFNSFYSPPRWTRCTNTWNSDNCQDEVPASPLSRAARNALLTNFPFEASHDVPANVSLVETTLYTTITTTTMVESTSQMSVINETVRVNVTHPAVEFLNVKMLEKSDSIQQFGELRFELLASVLFVWILTYFALRKTDFFRGITICILTIVCYLLLFCIFLRTVALDGAKDGLHLLFKPNWEQMGNPRVLLYALAQALHSLGVVLGPSILMGSCHKQHNNVLRDTIVLVVVTLLTVLMFGCTTFGTVGHLALKLDKPFWSVLEDDPGNVFVIYSVIIGSMPFPSFWGVLFYLVFLCLSLDSQIKLMATLVSALKEAYTYFIKQRFQGHSLFLAVICGICFIATIPYLTKAGIFFYQLVDHYIAVIATTFVALLEIGTLSWLYGAGNLVSCIQQMTGKTPSYFYQLTWMIISPLSILGVLVYSAIQMHENAIKKGYTYPSWAHILGWVMFGLTICWIPFLAIAAYRKAPKARPFERVKTTIQPRIRSHSESVWEQKPVIILNGSTFTVSEYETPDKLPELPSVPDAVQSYVDKHSNIECRNAESVF